MNNPKGFIVMGRKKLVSRLKKYLCGLKPSPRMWYQKFDTYILGLGFLRSKVDHYVYCKQVSNHFIYVVLYVDEMFLVRNNIHLINEVKLQLSSKFNIKDLGATNLILEMKIKRDNIDRKLYLSQRKYIDTIL